METIATIKKEQNISIVQNAFANFLQGNIPGILNACTENVDWATHENVGVPYAQTYQGKKGVAEFFTSLSESIDYTEFQPKKFYADADKVFVKGYHKAKVKSTAKTFAHEFLMEFTLSDGNISSFFAWVDTRDQSAAFSN